MNTKLRTGNDRSKSAKHQSVLVLALLAVLAIGLSSTAYASKSFPTPDPPPDEHGYEQGEQCGLPGVVINRSDRRVRILGDTWEHGQLVWKQYDLTKNQSSLLYLCDTDYIGSVERKWKFDLRVIEPWVWGPYLYNMTYTCNNATVEGSPSFQCLFTKMNWGPQ